MSAFESMEIDDNVSDRMDKLDEEIQKIQAIQNNADWYAPSSSGRTSPASVLSEEDKTTADSRSIFVGNVDFGARPAKLEAHFRSCGTINRVTILTDRYSGKPKGFAYIEFVEVEGKQNAMALDGSTFLYRKIKVTEKRTNKPGMKAIKRPLQYKKGHLQKRYGEAFYKQNKGTSAN
ncbi:RRM domain-containing protein [Aphelenchoides bicaudatus]|nr:RRM domain-containing protein [Aphelenchoides bicaudatus]